MTTAEAGCTCALERDFAAFEEHQDHEPYGPAGTWCILDAECIAVAKGLTKANAELIAWALNRLEVPCRIHTRP